MIIIIRQHLFKFDNRQRSIKKIHFDWMIWRWKIQKIIFQILLIVRFLIFHMRIENIFIWIFQNIQSIFFKKISTICFSFNQCNFCTFYNFIIFLLLFFHTCVSKLDQLKLTIFISSKRIISNKFEKKMFEKSLFIEFFKLVSMKKYKMKIIKKANLKKKYLKN